MTLTRWPRVTRLPRGSSGSARPFITLDFVDTIPGHTWTLRGAGDVQAVPGKRGCQGTKLRVRRGGRGRRGKIAPSRVKKVASSHSGMNVAEKDSYSTKGLIRVSGDKVVVRGAYLRDLGRGCQTGETRQINSCWLCTTLGRLPLREVVT